MKLRSLVFPLLLCCGAAYAANPQAREATPAERSAALGEPATDVPTMRLPDGREAKRVEPREGDICAECYHAVDKKDVVYQVEGQRIALHKQEVRADFAGQLLSLLAQAQPHGAFLSAAQRAGVSPAWFFIGLYVLAGLLFGALAAHRALGRGYPPLEWFLLALVFTLPGYLYLLTRPAREVFAPAGVPAGVGRIASTYEPQTCMACGAENHPSAHGCSRCGATLAPKMKSEVERAGLA